ncbi:MAG: hypothetical protein NT031_19490 [Planctomycetota bacterium]|nr:hypothetical protein [Planctomycetota bacterium]
MNEINAIPAGRPRRLVAIVLFGVFLACLGWAGLLVHQRTARPRHEAESILQMIARDGLDRSLPPATGAVEWFVAADPQGGVTIYEAHRHVSGPDGHRMASMVFRTKPKEMTLETWHIANDLSTSEYRAASGLAPAGLNQFPGSPEAPSRSDAPELVFIDQVKGQITVQRRLARHGREIVTAQAPVSLIPEGAMDAAVRLVARGQQAATFYSLTNEKALAAGKLQFTTVRMPPLAKDCVQVIHDLPGEAQAPAGRVTRIEFPGRDRQMMRASRQQILGRLEPSGVQAAERTLLALTSPARPPGATRPATTSAPRPTTAPAIDNLEELTRDDALGEPAN